MLTAGSLGHIDSWLPCTERSYYRRLYGTSGEATPRNSPRQGHFSPFTGSLWHKDDNNRTFPSLSLCYKEPARSINPGCAVGRGGELSSVVVPMVIVATDKIFVYVCSLRYCWSTTIRPWSSSCWPGGGGEDQGKRWQHPPHQLFPHWIELLFYYRP